ncbi:MFS transporter, partial [Citrobacter freundii]
IGQSMMGFSFIASAPAAQFYASQVTLAGVGLPGMMSYCALAFAILAAIIWFCAPNKRDSGNHRKNALHKSFKELSRDPVILTVWACAFTALTGFVIFQMLINGSLGNGKISQVEIRAFTLLGMLASFATGFLIRAWGDIIVLRFGLGISSLTLLSCIFLNLPLPFEIVLLSIGVALSIPGIISIISRRASHADRGMGIAIYSFCMFVGASLSPIISKMAAPSIIHTLLIPICIIGIAFILLCMPWVRTTEINSK